MTKARDQGEPAGAESPLARRLAEVLELKGHRVERLARLGGRPALAAHQVTFRDFDDAYLVDLCELPDDEEVARPEWQEFLDRLERSGLERGVLVTNRAFNPAVAREAERQDGVALFTYDQLLADLFDFRPYLEGVVSVWESDPLHPGKVVIPARAARGKGGETLDLDPFVDEWLASAASVRSSAAALGVWGAPEARRAGRAPHSGDEAMESGRRIGGRTPSPERDPLFLLGRYGSGKTTFVKRLAARLARAYLEDPVSGRVPVLVPLKEYATLGDMDELIVARLAELAPGAAPPSRRAFRLLLEAGRFCLILDGLDELISRLEPGVVVKNFDKICALILPGTRAMITAREGYLGTPEDEAQVLGLKRPPDASPAARPPTRFERLYLEPIDDEAIAWYARSRFPERAEHSAVVFRSRPELRELARTPLLLELILRSMPLLEGKARVNPAVVMSAFIDSWAELGWSRRPILSSAEDALFFVTELAWHMHWGGQYRIHASELPGRIRMRFRDRLLASDDPDPFRADLAECPFLARDREGHYSFVQKAFLDFLAALAYMRYLVEHGTAPVDSRRTNPDMQRFVRDLATMDERYLEAYYRLLDELRGRADPTEWLFYRDLLPVAEKAKLFGAERDRVRKAQASAPPVPAPDMVFVPGGELIFGSFEHRDEMPVRRIEVAPFFIDERPVTNSEYRRFLEETGHRAPLWTEEVEWAWQGAEPPADGGDLPVTMVSCDDASAYAAWAGKRLPTEQEWEMAARGHEGRRYPWGDDFRREAVNGDDAAGAPLPAGGRAAGASVFGCHDMSGNVWEWTASRYDKFQGLTIVRGGSFRSTPDELRAANRLFWDPEFARSDIGFRCVASAAGAARERGTKAAPGAAPAARTKARKR